MDDRDSEKIVEEAGERRRDDQDMISVQRLNAPSDGMVLGHTADTLLREGINRATVRPPPEPPPWVVQSARVRESFPINFNLFVFCFLVFIFVVGFDSLFEFLASRYVIGYGWIYGNSFGCVKSTTWLAIRVALSGVTVSKSDHRVYSRSCWSSDGVSFIFPLSDVTIPDLLI
ncbi:unnamed protein product [Cuscuta epithymum]|uniref:Uncharacterized protein n=1 Tax=Cuscuta epithymum TaxID=186058 RepID=A0AAV0F660_9ASTE|nr:unnamed protein product [Cuscuta epithymum]